MKLQLGTTPPGGSYLRKGTENKFIEKKCCGPYFLRVMHQHLTFKCGKLFTLGKLLEVVCLVGLHILPIFKYVSADSEF